MQEGDIGDEQIVAHELNLAAKFFGQVLPAVPITLGQAVLKRNDGIVFRPLRPEADHIVRALRRFIGFLENVLSVLIKLAGRRVERNRDFFTRLIARLLNRFKNYFDGLDVRFHRGSETAFVADRCVVAAPFEHTF